MRVKKIRKIVIPIMRGRWTVLDVEEDAIELVKQFAKVHNKTVGDALSNIIKKALQ